MLIVPALLDPFLGRVPTLREAIDELHPEVQELQALRHRAEPRPGAAHEGALGGVACGGLVGLIVHQVFSPSLTEIEAIGLGVVAAIVGAIGDLGESLLKRSTGIKDSSQLIPGHGGVLDRFDGVMFSAGAVYLYLTLF